MQDPISLQLMKKATKNISISAQTLKMKEEKNTAETKEDMKKRSGPGKGAAEIDTATFSASGNLVKGAEETEEGKRETEGEGREDGCESEVN